MLWRTTPSYRTEFTAYIKKLTPFTPKNEENFKNTGFCHWLYPIIPYENPKIPRARKKSNETRTLQTTLITYIDQPAYRDQRYLITILNVLGILIITILRR